MRNKKQMQKTALKTKVKRMLIAGGLTALIAVPLLLGNAGMRKVDAAQGDVKINSTNFPDEEFGSIFLRTLTETKMVYYQKRRLRKLLK